MKLIIASSLAILCSGLLVGIVSGQNCGGGGTYCPEYLCCSIWGYCGRTEPWCGANCRTSCWRHERSDHRCGPSVSNSPCGQGRCCSVHGWCGGGNAYCGAGNCQYRCWSTTTPRDLALLTHRNLTNSIAVSEIVSEAVFDKMFSHRDDCPSQGFYSYSAFLAAAESFPGFGTSGDAEIRLREIAAFFAQISEATTGKWSDVEDPNAWGLCHINTTSIEDDYSPRGAIQLAHNSNYAQAGQAIGVDLVKNPHLVATDPIVSFKTAIWLWMNKHENKPSCHEILVDSHSNRVPISFRLIGKIINGALGRTSHAPTFTSSAGYYKRYCDLLGVSYGFDLKNSLDITSSSDLVARIQMPVE